MDRASLIQKVLKLEYILVGWNIVEAVVAIGSGIAARSIALVGFGLDSVLEVIAAVTLIWRLKKSDWKDIDEENEAERKALRIVGITFFLLAGYILYESTKKLWFHETPAESFVGIILAILSSIVMPVLGFRKRQIAVAIESKALNADAVETLVCSYLSITLLLGLGLNAIWGWWWADPVAGLVIVGFILKEGWEAVEESQE